MSKIPPQLRQSLSALLQTATAFAFRHLPGPQGLEDFLACRQHFVQRFLKISGALREWLAYLRNILFEALFYLLSKELFERSVAETLRVLGGMVGDDVGDQSASESLGALVGILRKKRVQRTSSTSITRRGRWDGCRGGRTWGDRRSGRCSRRHKRWRRGPRRCRRWRKRRRGWHGRAGRLRTDGRRGLWRIEFGQSR